jgi:hypothetical protein
MLKGTRLDEVAKAEVAGIAFAPASLSRVVDHDQLALNALTSTTQLDPDKVYSARVQLKDGRLLKVPVNVEPPRPQAALLSKGVQPDASTATSPVQLGSTDDLPLEGKLVFFLKSTVPANFSRNEKVEVAATDGSFDTQLSLADGTLMLEDAKTAMGSIEPLTRFGGSAFGPVHVRVKSAAGATGDWLPLGTLVRLPSFKELRCLRAPAKPCILTGSNLFLASSVAATEGFESPTDVPTDFAGTQLIVPHPVNGSLYLKLRDDPATVQTLTLPITPATPADSKAIAVLTQPTAGSPQSAPSTSEPTAGDPVSPPAIPDAAPSPKSTSPAAPPPDSSSSPKL